MRFHCRKHHTKVSAISSHGRTPQTPRASGGALTPSPSSSLPQTDTNLPHRSPQELLSAALTNI